MAEEPRYTYQKPRANIAYVHPKGGTVVLDLTVERIRGIATGTTTATEPLVQACRDFLDVTDQERRVRTPERLDLMSGVNYGDTHTCWTPTLKDMGLAFCSCLTCGATLMYWYDAEGTMDDSAVGKHMSWHARGTH